MKIKNCEVLLVSENRDEVIDWYNKITNNFNDVRGTDIRECNFPREGVKDYRKNVYFSSFLSKSKIYEAMNSIKANPIKFY